MALKSLNECLVDLNEHVKRNGLGIEAELIGIDNLRKKNDIEKFVNTYWDFLQQDLNKLKDRKNKGGSIRKLLKASYSLDKVTDFFLQDGLYFTLGHIYSPSILRPWYSYMDERWSNRQRDAFSQMYRVIR